jgi:polysaccharide biosynthesis transport protein
VDLRRQLLIVRHWLWLIVAATLLAAAASYVVSSSLPKVYEGRTTLIVGQSLSSADPNYNQLLASQRLSQTYAQLATTTPILSRVVSDLSLPLTPQDLRRTVSAQAPRDSTLVTVIASHGDPEVAAAIANEVADALIAASPAVEGRPGNVDSFVEEQLAATQRQITSVQEELEALLAVAGRTPEQDRQVEVLQSRLTTLRNTYSQLLAVAPGSGANLLSIVDPATPATGPSSPRVLFNTLLAAALGLMAALGLAFLIEHLDDTVKSPDDVTEIADLPTLGVISQIKTVKKGVDRQVLATLMSPRSPVAEAFRTLRTNLEFASLDTPLRTLLITSAVPGEGKSTISANVAIAFAQAGRKVILVDGDMRRPSIHRLFEIPNSYGLTTLLRADQTALDSVAHASEEPNLRIVTTGPLPPNPAELLGSQRMRALIARLSEGSDLIVIDSPPLHAVTDAAVLASEMDGVLIVSHAGRTKRGALAQAREALDRVGARVVGVTLNRLTERSSAGYYYRYYGDYYGSAGSGSAPSAPAADARSGR